MTTETITPLRQRMIEDMTSRKLGAHTQRGHIYSRGIRLLTHKRHARLKTFAAQNRCSSFR